MTSASVAQAMTFPRSKTGVLLVNLGTPDATDYWSMRRYLKEFLSDQPGDRDAEARLVADPEPHHSLGATDRQRQGLRLHLEQGAGREPAAHDHARPVRQARCLGRGARRPRLAATDSDMSSSNGACATATRRSKRASTSLVEATAATSFCWCRSIRNMRRRPRRRSATRPSRLWRPCGSSRRCGSRTHISQSQAYIDALARSIKAGDRQAPLQAGGPARLVPRRATEVRRQGRSLSGALHRDVAAPAPCDGPDAERVSHQLPKPLRSAAMAAALHRRDDQEHGEAPA